MPAAFRCILKIGGRKKKSEVVSVGKVEFRVGKDDWWELACFGRVLNEAKKRGRIIDVFWFDSKGNMRATVSVLDGLAGSKSALSGGYCWSLICRKSSITHESYFPLNSKQIQYCCLAPSSSFYPYCSPYSFPLGSPYFRSHFPFPYSIVKQRKKESLNFSICQN